MLLNLPKEDLLISQPKSMKLKIYEKVKLRKMKYMYDEF